MSSKTKRIKKASKFVDFIIIGYSSLVIIALILLLFYSISYWGKNYPFTYSREARAFYTAVGLAIITIMCQWIEGRFRAILRIMKTEKEVVINNG